MESVFNICLILWGFGGGVYTFIHLFSKGEGTHVEVRDCLVGVTALHHVDLGIKPRSSGLGKPSCLPRLSVL